MLGTRTVVLTTRRETRRQIARTLQSGGMDPRFAEEPTVFEDAILKSEPKLLIIDADSTDTESIARVAALLQGMPSPPAVVLLSMGSDKKSLMSLIEHHDIANLIAKHGAIRAVYPLVDEHELLVTCEKVLRRDIFGIEKYVGLWGVVFHRAQITGLKDKAPFLDDFSLYLGELDCPKAVIPSITVVADELISNAVIHAPHDEEGRPRYEHLGPAGGIELLPSEYVALTYGCDGQRLMLSVVDNFGRLTKGTLYRYLRGAFHGTPMTPEDKPSGAGLGLALSFKTIHQLVFNVKERVRTEAIAGWYLRVNNYGEFTRVGKSLNIFWLPHDSAPVDLRATEAAPPSQVVERSLPRPNGAAGGPSVAVTEDGAVTLEGRMDEHADFSRLEQVESVDMSRVTGFTSPGVVGWTRLMQARKGRPLVIHGCPNALVSQAAMVDGIFAGARVESLSLPVECMDCGTERLLPRPPRECLLPIRDRCAKCGGALELAGVPEEYENLVEILGLDAGAPGSAPNKLSRAARVEVEVSRRPSKPGEEGREPSPAPDVPARSDRTAFDFLGRALLIGLGVGLLLFFALWLLGSPR